MLCRDSPRKGKLYILNWKCMLYGSTTRNRPSDFFWMFRSTCSNGTNGVGFVVGICLFIRIPNG